MKLSLLVLPSASLFVLTPAFAPAPILEEAALSDVTLQVDGEFGDAVAISGDTMAAGAFQHDLSAHNAGAAFVYSWGGMLGFCRPYQPIRTLGPATYSVLR